MKSDREIFGVKLSSIILTICCINIFTSIFMILVYILLISLEFEFFIGLLLGHTVIDLAVDTCLFWAVIKGRRDLMIPYLICAAIFVAPLVAVMACILVVIAPLYLPIYFYYCVQSFYHSFDAPIEENNPEIEENIYATIPIF